MKQNFTKFCCEIKNQTTHSRFCFFLSIKLLSHRESKGKLPGSTPPVTKVQTPTAKNSEASVPAVTPTTAETRSLPGKVSHSRKQSLGSNSLKTNGSAKNGDSLSRCAFSYTNEKNIFISLMLEPNKTHHSQLLSRVDDQIYNKLTM